MVSSSESTDYLGKERDRVVLLVATASTLCFIPFVLNNFRQGRWLVGLCALAVMYTTGSNAWARARKRKPVVDISLMIVFVSIFLVTCFHTQGMIGIFWCYPAIVCHHFMLAPKQARVAEYVFLTVSLICGYIYIDFVLFTRLAATLLLVSAACRLFIKVIAKQHSEIRTLSERLYQDNEKLEKLEEVRRVFMEDISHGLGTPLSSVHFGIESLASGAVEPDELDEHLARIKRHVEWVSQAIRRLLNLSRWETSAPALSLKPTSLGEALFTTIEALAPRMKDAEIDLDLQGPTEVQVIADSGALRDIFIALVENSIQHSGGHCTLSINLQETDSVVKVTVADDGKGMDADNAVKATKRYYTTGGTGLGLAIVTHLLKAHGTEPHVHSRPRLGFAVNFELQKAHVPSAIS